MACGQRVRKAQPEGTENGSGTIPWIASSRPRDLLPRRGIERSSALV